MKMRHLFPDMYKGAQLARGEIYLPDEMEEYDQPKLNAIELERLILQRAPRAKIGNVIDVQYDESGAKLSYVVHGPTTNNDNGGRPFTQEEYIALLNKEKDI